MPTISRRISSLPPSPTVALNAKANAMARDGIKVINLSVGEPDFPTPLSIVNEGIAGLKAGLTKYGAPGGGLELKSAIVNKLKRDNGLEFQPAEIVCGIGAKEILFHLALAMLNEGDEVLIPCPYWVSYTAHCEAAGAKSVEIPMDLRSGGIHLTADMLESYASSRTCAVILNSPNNPGGYVLSEAQLRALGDYLVKKDWWIVLDEIYEYLSFDYSHVSLLKICPKLRDRTIVVNGMSKSFAMTGWRLGYGAGPREIMSLVQNLQSQSSTSIPGFIERAAAFALNQGRSIVTQELASLKQRRDFVVKALNRHGLTYINPQGAFYAFVDLRPFIGERSSMEFSERLLTEHKIAMVPGEAFGVPGFIRMSYAVEESLISAGVDGIKALCEAYRHEHR